MSIPSATIESHNDHDKRRWPWSATIRMWLSWFAVSILFLAVIYLAGLSSGAGPEDFAFVTVPP